MTQKLTARESALKKFPQHKALIEAIFEGVDESLFALASHMDTKLEAVAAEADEDDGKEGLIDLLIDLGKRMATELTQAGIAPDLVGEFDALVMDLNAPDDDADETEIPPAGSAP